MRTKVTKIVLKNIKNVMESAPDVYRSFPSIKNSGLSISTLNKIKRCKDFQEYIGKQKEITITADSFSGGFKIDNKGRIVPANKKQFKRYVDTIGCSSTFVGDYVPDNIKFIPHKHTLLQRIINLIKR
jgi:hypothetical protein